MTYVLTKEDIAAFRKADSLVVAFNPKGDRANTVRLFFRNKDRDIEREHTLVDCPVLVRSGFMNLITREVEAKLVAFGHVDLYHDQPLPSTSIVRQLRAGDDIEFEFHPDRHTNGYVAAAGLHADALLLHVYRGSRKFCFEVAQSTTPNDSTARMVRGLVESTEYCRDGWECRQNNWRPPAAITIPADEAAAAIVVRNPAMLADALANTKALNDGEAC